MGLQNLHTHTNFCDGKNSVEELIQSAIQLGMTSLGFSSHSYLPFHSNGAMKEDAPPLYHAEVLRQKKLYENKIPVFIGIEQDYYSPEPKEKYEYIIGSVHYVKKNGNIYAVDRSVEMLRQAAEESYNGDIYGLVEDYYALVADIAEKTHCQIVGHFDLICKYNEGNRTFDTEHPRCFAAAMNAIETLAKKNVVFEINTGAMARKIRSTPYPDRKILCEMKARKIPICISSDAHSTDGLLYGFKEASELARECGYREYMYWNGKEFCSDLLPY